jgi:hypothetical protein
MGRDERLDRLLKRQKRSWYFPATTRQKPAREFLSLDLDPEHGHPGLLEAGLLVTGLGGFDLVESEKFAPVQFHARRGAFRERASKQTQSAK